MANKTYHCGYCGKEFEPSGIQKSCTARGKDIYCSNKEYDSCGKKAQRKKNKEHAVSWRKQKNNPNSKRRCKICGRDPYPNYYFCPPCHAKVGSNDVDDWHTWDAVKVA